MSLDTEPGTYASEFESEVDADGTIHLTFVLLEPAPLGGFVRKVVDRKKMPQSGYTRSVSGGFLACIRNCRDRVKPLESRHEDTFSSA